MVSAIVGDHTAHAEHLGLGVTRSMIGGGLAEDTLVRFDKAPTQDLKALLKQYQSARARNA